MTDMTDLERKIRDLEAELRRETDALGAERQRREAMQAERDDWIKKYQHERDLATRAQAAAELERQRAEQVEAALAEARRELQECFGEAADAQAWARDLNPDAKYRGGALRAVQSLIDVWRKERDEARADLARVTAEINEVKQHEAELLGDLHTARARLEAVEGAAKALADRLQTLLPGYIEVGYWAAEVRKLAALAGSGAGEGERKRLTTDTCPHLSFGGDEGPVTQLGRPPRRWKCDECGMIHEDDPTPPERGAEAHPYRASDACATKAGEHVCSACGLPEHHDDAEHSPPERGAEARTLRCMVCGGTGWQDQGPVAGTCAICQGFGWRVPTPPPGGQDEPGALDHLSDEDCRKELEAVWSALGGHLDRVNVHPSGETDECSIAECVAAVVRELDEHELGAGAEGCDSEPRRETASSAGAPAYGSLPGRPHPSSDTEIDYSKDGPILMDVQVHLDTEADQVWLDEISDTCRRWDARYEALAASHAARTDQVEGLQQLLDEIAVATGPYAIAWREIPAKVRELAAQADDESVYADRDRYAAALSATHVAFGGDGEWCAKPGSVLVAGETGDLAVDVPALAAALESRATAAEARVAELEALLLRIPPLQLHLYSTELADALAAAQRRARERHS